MTFSLAGRCSETGQLGCAVTTSSVCVGARCGRVSADCVVFSQARTDPRLHDVGLENHAATRDPAAALNAMKAAATALHWRQLGVLSRSGAVAHFTGDACLPSRGGATGNDCLALGNFLANDDVLPAMLNGFETARGSLAQRLLAGLSSGQAAGGELAPLQSSSIVVFADQRFAHTDLRVDKSERPIEDLLRLLEDWEPKADAYLQRALDPDSAPPASEVEQPA